MPARKIFNGDVYPTTKGGDVVVIHYVRDKHILVEFMDENKYQTVTDTTALTRGLIHNPFAKNFCGVGYIGVGRFSTNPKLETFRAYKAWDCMLSRCYSESHKKRHPSTLLSNCHEEWHNLQIFGDWYSSQKGWDQPKWQLDKDLLGDGSMTYSPETCAVVPPVVNTNIKFINQGMLNKNNLPHGVYYSEKSHKFASECRVHGQQGKPKTMYFNTDVEAFLWYKNNKENLLKAIALEYKDRIEEKVFNRLMTIEVPNPF